MQEKVAAYLEEQRQKEAARTRLAREKRLVELDLYEKEFVPEGTEITTEIIKEYPYVENGVRYKAAPLAVTEEEWAEICRYAGEADAPPAWRRNRVSRFLYRLSLVVYLGGGVLGLVMLAYVSGGYGGLSGLIQALGLWVPAVLYGSVLWGLSEIIRLLDR